MKRGMRTALTGNPINHGSQPNLKENMPGPQGERRYIQRVDPQWKEHETSLELLKTSQGPAKEGSRKTCEYSDANVLLQQRRANVMSRSLRADSPLKQIFGGRNSQMYDSQHVQSHRGRGDNYEHSDHKLKYIGSNR